MPRQAGHAGPYQPKVITTRNRARIESGQTLQELAAKLGVSTGTLYRWEHFKPCHSIDPIKWGREVYGSTPDLFDGFDFTE